MELVNKKELQGFTIGKKYKFTESKKMYLCHETKDDSGEVWVMSKYKMLEYFTFEYMYKENGGVVHE